MKDVCKKCTKGLTKKQLRVRKNIPGIIMIGKKMRKKSDCPHKFCILNKEAHHRFVKNISIIAQKNPAQETW